jgi:hypothetical protein
MFNEALKVGGVRAGLVPPPESHSLCVCRIIGERQTPWP